VSSLCSAPRPSTRRQQQRCAGQLPAELAIRVIEGRWMLPIQREWLDGSRRFSGLQQALVSFIQRMPLDGIQPHELGPAALACS
jgi:hypothetical protein